MLRQQPYLQGSSTISYVGTGLDAALGAGQFRQYGVLVCYLFFCL